MRVPVSDPVYKPAPFRSCNNIIGGPPLLTLYRDTGFPSRFSAVKHNSKVNCPGQV